MKFVSVMLFVFLVALFALHNVEFGDALGIAALLEALM